MNSIKKGNSKKKITCPFCGSTNVAEILYGLPVFSDKLDEDIKRGKVVLGGCCISNNDPDNHCNNCNKDFQTTKDKSWQR